MFRYTTDSDAFRGLDSDRVAGMLNKLHSGELEQIWGPSQSMEEYGRASKPLADFPHFDYQLPILSSRALSLLDPLIAEAIRRLPITSSCGEFWALDIPWSSDGIARDVSKFRTNPDGTINGITDGVFLRRNLDGEMFCLARCRDVFVTGKFLNLAATHKLVGLVKNPVRVGCLSEKT